MTAEETALLAAILADPADDLPRLVYADRLEETGHAARAEFIRVQVELAGRGYGEVEAELLSRKDAVGDLARRQRDLWRQPTAGTWWGDGLFIAIGRSVHDRGGNDSQPSGLIRRGFVSEIRLPLAAFLAHAAVIFAAHPVTRVVLTDREPEHRPHFITPGYVFYTHGTDRVHDADDLPAPLYQMLTGSIEPSRNSGDYRVYPSRDRALAALSTAGVAYARKLARLDPLPALH